jgi:RHS repeat-associated protein
VGNAPKKSERLYLTGIEIYREYDNIQNTSLERITFNVTAQKDKFATIETRTIGADTAPARLERYQLNNYLGSAIIEADDAANVISYEEFHPYGTTSYQAMDSNIKAVAKRYRYTGQERDDESGLDYHGARYYVPWLGRWLSPDRMGAIDGLNIYAYVNNNPVKFNDPDGKEKVILVGGGDIENKDRFKFFNVGLKKALDFDAKVQASSNKSEKITILITDINVTEGMRNDLKKQLKQFGGRVDVKYVQTGTEITNYLNSKDTTKTTLTDERKKDKVSDIYFTGHGYRPDVSSQQSGTYSAYEPGHGTAGEEMSDPPAGRTEHNKTVWGADDVGKLSSEIFTKDALFDMSGICNAATPPETKPTQETFLDLVSKKLKVKATGWFGRSDYIGIYKGEGKDSKGGIRPAQNYPEAGKKYTGGVSEIKTVPAPPPKPQPAEAKPPVVKPKKKPQP